MWSHCGQLRSQRLELTGGRATAAFCRVPHLTEWQSYNGAGLDSLGGESIDGAVQFRIRRNNDALYHAVHPANISRNRLYYTAIPTTDNMPNKHFCAFFKLIGNYTETRLGQFQTVPNRLYFDQCTKHYFSRQERHLPLGAFLHQKSFTFEVSILHIRKYVPI